MKLVLLGDIHGNDFALRAVLTAATSNGADKLLITGDLIGYYYAPKKALELLKPWDRHVVRGNHEDMLIAARSDSAFLDRVDARYGTGLRTAIEQLSEEQLDELCSLPHPLDLMIDGCRILLCHGSPWNNDQYVYPDAQPELLSRSAVQDFDLVVLGHTHYPMQRKIGNTLLVNPGSVGQPRNRQPGAHWALFDTATQSLELRCEQYDASGLVQECQQRHPELPYLAEVLTRK
ncbi:metallophosphoesterase family protein [Thiobacillus thioparus]|uniref:metallophosphoesterase family protein n=1 Tax=Thiobacillus thioparus TaxID=931 RepID=UPI0003612E98|nr:YfcE family phosphodiesterase [Thiobacillus thioparus]